MMQTTTPHTLSDFAYLMTMNKPQLSAQLRPVARLRQLEVGRAIRRALKLIRDGARAIIERSFHISIIEGKDGFA
jgi:hypothetical protein